MERRAAESRVVAPAAAPSDASATLVDERPAPANRVRGTSQPRARAAARPVVLTREQEYRYIRADLNRLLVTAGSLLVVMIVLLFLIEA